MMLDPRTLAVTGGVALLMQTLIILYVWYFQLRDRAVGDLAIGACLGTIGALLGVSRPHLPPLITHFGAAVVLVSAHAFGVRAFSRFVGNLVPARILTGLVLVFAIAMAFFLFVAPRTDIRIALYSLAVAVNSLAIAALLLDIPRGPLRVTHWPVGFLHLLHGSFALARAFAVLIEESRGDLFEPSLIQVLWFLQSLLVGMLTFTGMVLMVTQRFSLELERERAAEAPFPR